MNLISEIHLGEIKAKTFTKQSLTDLFNLHKYSIFLFGRE